MSQDVDDYLQGVRSGGALEEEGSFSINLREAARKMALFGQQEQGAWTLKFGQVFQRLGCRRLELIRTSDIWRFDGIGAQRDLDLVALKHSLPKLGLGGGQEPEDLLAVGLSAMAVAGPNEQALESACWVQNSEIELLYGNLDKLQSRPKGPTLILWFPKDASPPLPRSLWENSFSYCTMEIFYKTGSTSGVQLNNIYSTQFMIPPGQMFWLEYLGVGQTQQDLTLTPTGETSCELGETISKNKLARSSHLRWKGTAEGRGRSIVILAKKDLEGRTEIHPVVAGCVLAPIRATGLPEGFKIVVTADECPTDLGHNQLRRSSELKELIESCKPPLRHAIELMLTTTLEKRPTVVKKPRTPLVADAAPGCMAFFWLFTIPFLFAEPFIGTFVSLFFGGPPGIYFWYSRRQRGKEFDELIQDAHGLLNSRKAELNAQGPTEEQGIP